ncbi:MAG: hypothetical protein ABI779_16905 [Acidobacteriota bacterium]
MRLLSLVLGSLLLAPVGMSGTVFVAPLEGAQVLGAQALEISTDAAAVDRVDFSVDGILAGVARKAPYRIVYDFGTSLLPRTITATVWSQGFKSSERTSITTTAFTAADTLDVDIVELPLRVRSSFPIRPADLRVRENGVEQIVRDVRRERPPAHFAFVVDRSLSMDGGKLDAALGAVRDATRQLAPGDTSSLVLFNHHVDRPRSASARIDVTPSGGTALRDALVSVASRQRTYAIVITDGGDRNSLLTEEAALRKISGVKTTLHALVLGDEHTRFLDRVAANTGGSVTEASRETVARELQRVLEDINSRYLVIYQSRGTERGWRRIEVQPLRRGLAIVSARKGYFAE